jgi:uncharacterized DUF497 family protein
VGSGAIFDWDSHNIEHLAKHAVTIREAEQAILDASAILVEMQEHDSEARIQTVGITAQGRILTVIFTFRGESIRPVTAFDAPRRLQRVYFQQRAI